MRSQPTRSSAHGHEKSGDASRLRRAAAEWTDRLLQYLNVFACDAGQREVGGRRTDEASLVVSVERKLPVDALRLASSNATPSQ